MLELFKDFEELSQLCSHFYDLHSFVVKLLSSLYPVSVSFSSFCIEHKIWNFSIVEADFQNNVNI